MSATTVADVLPSRVKKLQHGVVEPSLEAANRYIANLADEKRNTSSVQPSATPKVTVPSTVPYTVPYNGSTGGGGTGTTATGGSRVTTTSVPAAISTPTTAAG